MADVSLTRRVALLGAVASVGFMGHDLAFAQASAGSLPLVVGSGPSGNSYSVPIQTLLFFTALSFLPAVLLMMTGFTRIVIVLSLLRQARGYLAPVWFYRGGGRAQTPPPVRIYGDEP